MTTNELFKKLKAPFMTVTPDGEEVPAIYWRYMARVDGKIELTPYIKADQIKERLNYVMGIVGWEHTYHEMQNNEFTNCALTLHFKERSITHEGFGERSREFEIKGMESDALKRAAKSFGIGAYINDIPNIRLNCIETVERGKKKYIPVTANGEELPTGTEQTSYINTMHPARMSLTNVYKFVKPEQKAELDPLFQTIYKALS